MRVVCGRGGRTLRSLSTAVGVVFLIILVRTIYHAQSIRDYRVETITKPNSRENPSIFVFLASQDHDRFVAVRETWLQEADSFFVCARYKDSRLPENQHVFLQFQTDSSWPLIRSLSLFDNLFLPAHADWLIIAADDTFLLVDELRMDLSVLDPDEPFYSIIGTYNFEQPETAPGLPIIILSRAARKLLGSRLIENESGCDWDGSIDECLLEATRLNWEKDKTDQYRYQIVNRHFDNFEMAIYQSEHGKYNDGFEIISQLSPDLVSFHNLNPADIRILDVFLRRIRLWPN